jgi:hypothetical protein
VEEVVEMSFDLEFAQNNYAEHAQQVAERLRDIADRFEREANREPNPSSLASKDQVEIALAAVHEVLWGVPNLNLDSFVASAKRVDAAAQRDER